VHHHQPEKIWKTQQTLYTVHSNNEEQFQLPSEPAKRPKINDEIPSTDEIIKQIKHLHNNKAPGFTGMRVEDIKGWAIQYEENKDENKDHLPFSKLVKIIQSSFETGTLPKALHISTLVLIPKPNSRDYRGIGLLEIIRKLMTAIIDNRLRSTIEFQDEIHRFRKSRGTGTAILCNKLLCQQSNMEGKPLKQIYIDLSKAYNTLDRKTTLKILEHYGVGKRTKNLLESFWKHHHVIPRASGYHGRCFQAHRGVTQGNNRVSVYPYRTEYCSYSEGLVVR
jgi:hypothetical protein